MQNGKNGANHRVGCGSGREREKMGEKIASPPMFELACARARVELTVSRLPIVSYFFCLEF